MPLHCVEIIMDRIIELCFIAYFLSAIGACGYFIFFLRSILKDCDLEVRSEGRD